MSPQGDSDRGLTEDEIDAKDYVAMRMWRQRAETAERERDAARAALAKYGRHAYDCGSDTKGGLYRPSPCTCGLDALKEAPAHDA